MSADGAKNAEDWLAAVTEEGHLSEARPILCKVCMASDPAWNSWALCPMGCGVSLCCLGCLLRHMDLCAAPVLSLPKFGEGFCGARAPLSWAMAGLSIPIISPFDLKLNPMDDFFTKQGKKSLERFNHEHLAVEHWGPDCKLMSMARGIPIQLPCGRWIPGPPAVRSEEYPMGNPDLRGRMAWKVRQSNAMFLHSLKRLEWRLKNWGFAVAEHPWRSWGWRFPLAISLLNTWGVFFTVVWNCCHGGKRKICDSIILRPLFVVQLSTYAAEVHCE